MNELQIFQNKDFGEVRTTIIDGEPWFVAADVCKALDLSNTTVAIDRLDADEKAKFNLGLSGGEANCINESGLYAFVLSSRKPEARAFKRWITHEVIPSIRKTGSYTAKQKTPAEMFLEQAKMMVDMEKKLSATEQKVDSILDIMTVETMDNWQETMSNEVKRLCTDYHLNYQDEFSYIYTALESSARVDLQSRVSRKIKRIKLYGAHLEQCRRVNKLNVIADDPKLRLIFESILKKQKIKRVGNMV